MLLCFISSIYLFIVEVWTLSLSHKLTFNDNVLGRPLLVEGREAVVQTETDDMLSEVKVLGIKAEQAEPQLPHRLSVLPALWPETGLQVEDDKINALLTCTFTNIFTGALTECVKNTHKCV